MTVSLCYSTLPIHVLVQVMWQKKNKKMLKHNKLTIPLNSNHSLHFLDFIMTQHVTKRSPYDQPLTGENLLKDDAAKTVQALRKYKKRHFNMF